MSLSSTKWNPNHIRVSPAEEPSLSTEEPSLRDQFAMAALSGGMATEKLTDWQKAGWCYRLADAMMEARK